MNVADIIDRQFNSTELELPDRYFARNITNLRDSASFSFSLNDSGNMDKLKNSILVDEHAEIYSNEGSFHEDEDLEANLTKSPLISSRKILPPSRLSYNRRRQAISSKGIVIKFTFLRNFWFFYFFSKIFLN